MTTRFALGPDGDQDPADKSFIGGQPRIPADEPWPACGLCGSPLTFFFQIDFPARHPWEGKTLAVFACTACAVRGSLIPPMLEGQLKQADIPEGFLTEYQSNFRLLVFDSARSSIRWDHAGPIKFRALVSEPGTRHFVFLAGGSPVWLLEDESPRSYAGSIPMLFLLQLHEGFVFETVAGAPAQMEVAWGGKGQRASTRGGYRLFLGNAVYFFGTQDGESLVYAVTQVD